MNRLTMALRRRAINALRCAVGDLTPTSVQADLLSTVSAEVDRAWACVGKGAGQSTSRLMLALKILEDDR